MNYAQLHQKFEKEKNLKAFALTLATTLGLFLFFFLVSWAVPLPPVPAADEGIEVNLGNSDMGMGQTPVLIPGEPTEAAQTNFNPAPATQASAETQPDVAENKEPDAPVVYTSTKPEIKNNKASDNSTSTKKNNQPVVNTQPTPPKAKAVYAGGKSTGNGGNSDSYSNSKNQGIAGGTGDQGKPNGNPNSDSYNGNGGTGSSGVKITGGLTGRHTVGGTRFQDSYKYGGIVLVNVTVDENGNVTSASLKQPSAFADINKIAVKRAYEVKFSKGSEVQSGTIQIKFENPKG